MAAKTLFDFITEYYDHWQTYPSLQNIWDAATEAAEEKFTFAQQPQPAMCLGCEYWRMPSGGHCMRGDGVEFCFKVGTHAGVR